MSDTPFARLAALGEQLSRTTKRLELTALVAAFLTSLSPEETAPAVRMVVGQVFPEWDGRVLNVSWGALTAVLGKMTDAPPGMADRLGAQAVDGGEYVALLLEQARRQPPSPPPLTILEVHAAFEAIATVAGPGSRTRKESLLSNLLGRASPAEAKFMSKVVFQEMRHGVNEGIMLDAIAKAARASSPVVRRANQFLGDLGELARVALAEGEAGLGNISVRLFRPIKPMLAQSAEQIDGAFARYSGQLALEYKLDGARVHVHVGVEGGDVHPPSVPPAAAGGRTGEAGETKVRIYSRNLADVTDSLPDLAEEVRAKVAAREAILDGEAIAVDARGRPLPFQDLMRRFGRKEDIGQVAARVPVQLYLFDVLYADGRPTVDLPERERWKLLEAVSGGLNRVRRLVPSTVEEGRAFAGDAYRDGHEGVMAKDLDSPYAPGVRGKAWLKVKQVTSLDLVIVAADWGYGRRHGWLSNYHLAALDDQTGEYMLVGKTFKGLTDDEFQAMTARLLALEQRRQRGTVVVQPQIVVEVLFNEIQESSQYPSGLALRFARIARSRDDKAAGEADTLQTVRGLYERQFERKGRL